LEKKGRENQKGEGRNLGGGSRCVGRARLEGNKQLAKNGLGAQRKHRERKAQTDDTRRKILENREKGRAQKTEEGGGKAEQRKGRGTEEEENRAVKGERGKEGTERRSESKKREKGPKLSSREVTEVKVFLLALSGGLRPRAIIWDSMKKGKEAIGP